MLRQAKSVNVSNLNNDKLKGVFDYTKAQFHNTNYAAPKIVKRSDYKSASMAENEFNDELQDWKKRNGENINASARQRFS